MPQHNKCLVNFLKCYMAINRLNLNLISVTLRKINTWVYFSFPTFVNMLLGRFPEAILPFEETDADVRRILREPVKYQYVLLSLQTVTLV